MVADLTARPGGGYRTARYGVDDRPELVREDRAAALQRLLDAELAKPLPSSRKATELAGEIRQLEATVVKLVGMLVPDPPAEAGPPKSAQHQAAARTRWDRRSHRSA